MGAHQSSLETSASAESVWKIWSNTSSWGTWNPDVAGVDLDGPFAVGTTGLMRMKSGRQHRIHIEEIEPGQMFRLEAAAMPGHPFAFQCEVEPSGSGSRISQSVTVRGPLAALLSPMMGPSIAKGFGPILQALSKKAESGS